ncbi:MAG: acyl-CoA thioesterase [Chloroflexi bacterium]|nr:acyl-CoA thioesterase [Chloroflexota bacterium]MCC6895955.1 acyl-CoA thioesterase [Anaerolineae bacterium]
MLAGTVLPKELESSTVIRFQDCDPFGHLNNARYIDYFMNAREDHLRDYYGFNIFEVGQKMQQGWVVTKNQLAYLAPAMVQEEVLIRTALIRMTESVLVVEGLMFDKAARRLKAVSWIEFTFVSLQTGRTTQHPEEFMSRFGAVVVGDVFTADGFNGRVDALKAQYRRQPQAMPTT